MKQNKKDFKKYSVVKIPSDSTYSTWQAYNVPIIEYSLNMIAQGYGLELYKGLEASYINICRGYMRLLCALVKEDKEQEAEY